MNQQRIKRNKQRRKKIFLFVFDLAKRQKKKQIYTT